MTKARPRTTVALPNTVRYGKSILMEGPLAKLFRRTPREDPPPPIRRMTDDEATAEYKRLRRAGLSHKQAEAMVFVQRLHEAETQSAVKSESKKK